MLLQAFEGETGFLVVLCFARQEWKGVGGRNLCNRKVSDLSLNRPWIWFAVGSMRVGQILYSSKSDNDCG